MTNRSTIWLLAGVLALAHGGPLTGQQSPARGRCADAADVTNTSSADLSCIVLLPTARAEGAAAVVEMRPVQSPFGVAVTPEGRHRWQLRFTVTGLPDARGLQANGYVAWATPPTLAPVIRLGEIGNGTHDLGDVAFNKFTIWISAEVDPASATRAGPIVLRGTSPSSQMHPEDLLTQSPMAILADAERAGSHAAHGMSMPPMHPAVEPLPGLMTLMPRGGSWLPTAADLDGVPWAAPRQTVELGDGGTLDLEAGLVRRRVGNRVLLMYGFNGQMPGPLIEVPAHATIFVNFTNSTELPTAVHWHGVRLDNRFDGVPGLTQDPVLPGETFRYQIYFRDAGIYWYHPHHREDIAQDLGLYGNMLVAPDTPDYYNPVDAESVLMLDDMLLGETGLVPYGDESANYMLMGRFGNQMLINGEPHYAASAQAGEVIRYYFTNVSNTRTFNLSFRPQSEREASADRVGLGQAEGVLTAAPLPLRVVATDISRFERETWAESVTIAPAERYVVEVAMPETGSVALVNAVQGINHRIAGFFTEATELGRIAIDGAATDPRPVAPLREHTDLIAELDAFRPEFDRPVDLEMDLRLVTRDLPLVVEQLMAKDRVFFNPVEWAGTMAMMNWASTGAEVEWQLVETATGAVNEGIEWRFRVGDVVKIRLTNNRNSFHAMQHPVHFHGQRFLVLDRDGVRNDNLAWKDTVLVPVGSTIDLLLELSNPGKWMVHCHIAEHLESGMKMVFVVEPPDGPTTLEPSR